MTWVWQVSFGLILAALFYWSRWTAWVRAHAQSSLPGYLFAVTYALASVLLIDFTFTSTPLPRFGDIFVAGVALTAYLFGTGPAALLLMIALGVSMWVLPPWGSFYVADRADWYRLVSFGNVSVLLIFVIGRLKREVKRNQPLALGYIFATAYAAAAMVVALMTFHSQPPPRFMDIFLVGIAITAYFFTVTPAAYLLAISVAISAWILPPAHSFAIARQQDWYRILSFTVVAALLICLTGRLKRWSIAPIGALGRNERSRRPLSLA